MLKWFSQLDDILRGDATRIGALADGEIRTPVRGLVVVVIALSMIYGVCMASFTVIRLGGLGGYMQVVASAVKLPLLFFLTLVVTLPSLYVFNALVGTRLRLRSVVRLMVAMLGVITAVLASLGPIVAFFGVSTTSYPFMKLLNVVAATVAGLLGLAFLLRTLHRLVLRDNVAAWQEPNPSPPEVVHGPAEYGRPAPWQIAKAKQKGDGALELVGERTEARAKAIFRIWVLVFALVGAQMSWVLRPFIGDPRLPFAWFRARESNFFVDVFEALFRLLGG